MVRAHICDKSVPRVELDQRARDDRLRLERLERLLVLRRADAGSWVRRLLRRFGFGRPGLGSGGRGTRRPLSDRRPVRIPQIPERSGNSAGWPCRLGGRGGRLGGPGIPPFHQRA